MSRHIGIGDPSKKMRAQGKFEGAIVWSRCIQMDAGEHHPLKKLNRRFDMPDPSLSRPVRIAGDFNALLDCDNAILMPRQSPVFVLAFAERNDSNWNGAGQKHPSEEIHRLERYPNAVARRQASAGSITHSTCQLQTNELHIRECVAAPFAPAISESSAFSCDQAPPPKRMAMAGPQP